MELPELNPELKKIIEAKVQANVAAALKAPSSLEPQRDGSATALLIIKELSTQLPSILNQIKEVKKTTPVSNPVQSGLEEAIFETAKTLTLQILNENPEMMSNLKTMLEDSLAASLAGPAEE